MKEVVGNATQKSELERIGFLGETPCSYKAMPLGGHFELHIGEVYSKFECNTLAYLAEYRTGSFSGSFLVKGWGCEGRTSISLVHGYRFRR